ncbi:MAG: phosphatase PAP2 family protein [Leptospiraceae bacterium]|nr:phosphatase PAP2 family protein [Leptospiraceae bacterium]MDW8306329.1 phosphatase PAP2 family protein [Leptospiraceae bacterium]
MLLRRWQNLRAVDGVTFVYIIANLALLLLYTENIPGKKQAYLSFGSLLVLQFCILFLLPESYRIGQFLRDWYPILFSVVYYPMIGVMNQAVFQGFFDNYLVRLEENLFGMQPALEFSQKFPHIIIYELMHLFYFFYYFFIFVAGYLLSRYNENIFRKLIFSVILMGTVQFYFFTLIPTAGPKFFFEELKKNMHLPPRGPFSFLMYHILSNGEIAGAAFPSSHVSVALMSVLYVHEHLGAKKSLSLWVMFIGLFLSTIYTRQHYAVDSIAGVLYCLLAYWFTDSLYDLIDKIQRRLEEYKGGLYRPETNSKR